MTASEQAPLPPERVLQIVGDKLAELSGSWTVEPGPILKGPGTLAVRLGEPHTGEARHVDLEFLLNVDKPDETGLVDCATGFAPDLEEAIRQAVNFWADTTASVILELLEQRGRFADHFQPGAEGGFPGWHAIVGAASGWGLSQDTPLKIHWLAEQSPWTELAPLIKPALDREHLNGVRLFIGQSSTFQSCEVKINGRLHEEATAALAAMNWPRTEKMTAAKVYLLLVHREGA